MRECRCTGECGHKLAAKPYEYTQVELCAIQASWYALGRLAERNGVEPPRAETDKFLLFWKERYAHRVEVLRPSMRIVHHIPEAWGEYERERIVRANEQRPDCE